MRGEKISLDIREDAIVRLMVGYSVEQAAKELSLPPSTVRNWKKNAANDSTLNDYRQKHLQEFIDDTWSRVMKCLEIIGHRLDIALYHEEELECLRTVIKDNADIPEKTKTALFKKIDCLLISDIGKLCAICNTLYDIHASLVGEPTAIHNATVLFKGWFDL